MPQKTPTNPTKKAVKEPRKVKAPKYRSFRLQKAVKPAAGSLPGSFRLFKGALEVLVRHWKPFLGIVVVYGVLNILFVQSFSGNDVAQTKSILDDLSSGHWDALLGGLSLFVYMAGASGNVSSDVAGAYQLILTLTTSLALIWMLRQTYAEKKARMRDGFYRGMYPLVPFILVLCVVALQLAPLALGAFLFNTVNSAGIAAGGVEAIMWAVVFFLLAVMSLYMLCSSLFALYIVCLPDMTPMAALRSARELVRHRRWTIMRKVVFLPIALFVLAMAVVLPFIFLATALAPWMFFLLSMLVLPIIHSYMYRLYRELL